MSQQGRRRKSVLDWSYEARSLHPDKDYQWWSRYAAARSKIEGFEKDFSLYEKSHGLDVVLLLVNILDRDTRSPAKKQAIADWREKRVRTDNS